MTVLYLAVGFEGERRMDTATPAIESSKHVDVLVVVQNERLLSLLPSDTPIEESMFAADEVARQAIVGVASLVATSQLINVDLDVRSVDNAGLGLISIGRASATAVPPARGGFDLAPPDITLERVKAVRTRSQGSALTLHEVHEIGRRSRRGWRTTRR